MRYDKIHYGLQITNLHGFGYSQFISNRHDTRDNALAHRQGFRIAIPDSELSNVHSDSGLENFNEAGGGKGSTVT